MSDQEYRNKPIVTPAGIISADWFPADASAVQACCNGTATPEQQVRAMNWILHQGCRVDDSEYRTNERDHAFASGRRFVGLQIRKLYLIRPSAFTKNGGEN